jgi:hypothetical protein
MTQQLGRYRSSDVVRRPVKDEATKTLVATFTGTHFVAEREDQSLCIYMIGDDDGMPGANVVTSTTDMSSMAGLAALNRANEAARKARMK